MFSEQESRVPASIGNGRLAFRLVHIQVENQKARACVQTLLPL